MARLTFVFLACTLFSLATSQSGFARDIAFPRYSPLSIIAIDNPEIEQPATNKIHFTFGEPLSVISSDENSVTVRLQNDLAVKLRKSDVIITQAAMFTEGGRDFASKERIRLSFWDSQLRTETFLKDGMSLETQPLFVEIITGNKLLPIPTVTMSNVELGSGRQIKIANGMVPFNNLDQFQNTFNNQEIDSDINITLIVDATKNTKEFSQRRLLELSSSLESDFQELYSNINLEKISLLDGGNINGPEAISPRDLRKFLGNQIKNSDSQDLSRSLTRTLDTLALKLKTDRATDAINAFIFVLGSGLQRDFSLTKSYTNFIEAVEQSVDSGQEIVIFTMDATPEPSLTKEILFTGINRVAHAHINFSESISIKVNVENDSIRADQTFDIDIERSCDAAFDDNFFCLGSQDSAAVDVLLNASNQTAHDWFTVPLWYVVDGDILSLSSSPSFSDDVSEFTMPGVSDVSDVFNTPKSAAEDDYFAAKISELSLILERERDLHADELTTLQLAFTAQSAGLLQLQEEVLEHQNVAADLVNSVSIQSEYISSLEKENISIISANQQLEELTTTLRNDNAIIGAQLNEALEQVGLLKIGLETEKAERVADSQKMSLLNQEHLSLAMEHKAISEQLTDYVHKNRRLEALLEQREVEVSDLNMLLENYSYEIHALRLAEEKKNSAYQELNSDYVALIEDHGRQESEIARLSNLNSLDTSEINLLQTQISSLIEKSSSLERELEALKLDNVRLSKLLTEQDHILAATVSSAESSLHHKAKEYSSELERINLRLESDLQLLEAELSSLRERESAEEDLKNQNLELVARALEAEAKWKKLETDLTSLRLRLENSSVETRVALEPLPRGTAMRPPQRPTSFPEPSSVSIPARTSVSRTSAQVSSAPTPQRSTQQSLSGSPLLTEQGAYGGFSAHGGGFFGN